MKLTGAQILWECAGARRRHRRVRLSRAARFCRPTTRCSTIRSATSWCATSRARRTWPTATRARRGKVGVAIATSGPGATNMVTGIATAMMDSSPIVCITGQVGSKLIGSDAFQETDITGITLPITKHNYPGDAAPSDVAPAIREAFAVAASGRPGPVLVDITKDAQQGSVRVRLGRRGARSARRSTTRCRATAMRRRGARADQRRRAAADSRRPRRHAVAAPSARSLGVRRDARRFRSR